MSYLFGAGSGLGGWQDDSGLVRPVTIANNVIVGGSSLADTDEILSIQDGILLNRSYATANGGFFIDSAHIQTTDATTTTLLSVTQADDDCDTIQCIVSASVAADATRKAAYGFYARADRTSGTTSISGVTQFTGSPSEASGVIGWSATIDASGGAWRVRVTGESSQTIEWVVGIMYNRAQP